MKSKLISGILIVFLLFSCEDSDRIEAIKSELRNKNKDGKNDEVDSQRKVSISAPSQNEAPYEASTTGNFEIVDYNEDNSEEYIENEEYEDYGD